MKAVEFILASGGSGGHVFPAEALADVLSSRGRNVGYVTTGRGRNFAAMKSIPIWQIAASGLAGRGWLHRLIATFTLGLGVLQALLLLRRLKPLVVVGFGGYASVPVLAAAWLLRYKIILHEQNAVLGRANRLFANHAELIAVTFPLAEEKNLKTTLIVTGNPVRGSFHELAYRPYRPPEEGGRFGLVVTGGSQGTRVFSDVLPAALALMPGAMRSRLDIVQQCRSEDVERVRASYAAAGIKAEIAEFFNNLAARLDVAHLVICRSGASTITELTTAGMPSILVPYPHAADQHQLVNARFLSEAKAAWLLEQHDFSPETLSALLQKLMNNPQLLIDYAANARRLGVPNAARHLADLVEIAGDAK
ncbi:MAG: undecaprenyldiphospho-muramoylpentapeptide beta-N-acetylglucosaminyltransferase [Candidatus Symbiobacter sp.]|nr:undecaprenyldiphospho-muramoylpentapeptide beta-N-acetylglucosaminyltransferase [Candidatus Symbiobacter sp.]